MFSADRIEIEFLSRYNRPRLIPCRAHVDPGGFLLNFIMRVFPLTAAALLCATALSANAADRFDSLTASGALSAGVDVTHLVRSSVDARLTQARVNDRTDGGSLWLDVAGAKTRAEKLTGDAGYKATVGVANLKPARTLSAWCTSTAKATLIPSKPNTVTATPRTTAS